MGVEAAYLEGALAAIAAEHGTVEAYLRGPLGVTSGLRAKVEGRLLG
jgi:hypothetical protein